MLETREITRIQQVGRGIRLFGEVRPRIQQEYASIGILGETGSERGTG
jgi:restriction endonuclease